MWLDAEVEAFVEYKAALSYPTLRAIKWDGRQIDFASRPRIERTTSALLYRFDEDGTSYTLRFEFERQRWFLEGIDDSGATDWPPPRVFAPTDWNPKPRRRP